MHLTSGFSPASGEMLDTTGLDLYGDSGEPCGTTFTSVDHTVPESSHTVEIEYIFETEESKTESKDVCKDVRKPIEEKKKDRPPKVYKTVEKMAVDDTESDLTNLTWLQNITNIMSVTEFPIRPMSPGPPVKPHQQSNARLQKFNQTIAKCQKDFLENRNEYRSNAEKKPPYSYSTLICLAMKNNNNKMTLSAIYSWIRESFKYFRTADITWQNSIRHNLSLNKVFVKMARSKNEPGKGGFWKLDLAHLEGAKRISNRPSKKKKTNEKPEVKPTEEQTAVANIPAIEITNIEISDNMNQAVTLHLPEFNLDTNTTFEADNIGANVIVEPNVPPPLIAEDDLSTLLLNPTEWGDLQLDMLDNYLDTCFK